MRQTNVRGSLSLRGFRKLRTGAIVATGVILLGLGFLAPTVSASEQDGVWVARTVEEVKADLQKEGDLFKYVIKWGDTLSVISEASNIPVDVLQEMNQASGKNLFLPHNELYFTEAETVSDTVTKHKIVIKESGASGEVRTYEVLLKKDQETKAVTFELTDVTEKVEKMTVNYSPVYQPVSAPVVERAEESGEGLAPVAPAVTSPEVKEETEAPVAPKAEDAATTPAPKVEEPATPAPKVEEPATPAPKVEESAESAEPKTEAPTTPENKEEQPGATEAEAPTETAEPKVTEPEAAKPAEPKEADSTSEKETEEVGTEVKPAPKETGEEGKAEDSVSSTASEGESTVTQPSVESGTDSTSEAEGKTSEESGTQAPAESATASKETDSTSEKEVEESGATGKEAKETEEKLAPKEDSTSGDEGNAETSNNPTTGATTSADSDESGNTTEEKAEMPKVEEPAPAVDSTNEAPNEGESENPVAEGTPVTEEQPSTDNTASSSATSNSADSSSSTESTAPESTTATTGNTSNSSTDVTTDGNSNDSTSNEEKPQGDEPAVEHQGSEKSLEKETEDSNKAAIDEDRATKDKEINESTLNEEQKKEAREKVTKLTEEYHNKLKSEQDTDKQADLIDEYRDKLREIETPGVEHDGPDFKKPIESHAGGTTIDENSTVANSALTSSNPSSQPSSSEDSSQTQPVATSDSSATGNSSFRSAVTYQPRVTRRPRSVSEPQNKVSIYYNFDGMKDIPGFFDDLGGKNEVDIPKGVSGEALKSILKARIDKKKAELESKGYKISDEYFVGIDQADATHYDYVVTFTKETTGTTGFRIAPKVQVRAKKVVKRDLSNKTKHINVYYNLTSLKDIAGALGELGGENVLTFSGETSKEELKRAVEEKTKAQIEKLKKQGFTVTSKTDLDQIIEGGDSYDYVVEFTKEAKTQPVGTTGFRNAPLVQRRAKRSTEAKETVNVNIYFNLKTLPGIAGALDVDGETTIKLPKNASEEEVKEAIKAKIAKVESRGYKVNDFYFGAKTEKGYDYVVEFTK